MRAYSPIVLRHLQSLIAKKLHHSARPERKALINVLTEWKQMTTTTTTDDGKEQKRNNILDYDTGNWCVLSVYRVAFVLSVVSVLHYSGSYFGSPRFRHPTLLSSTTTAVSIHPLNSAQTYRWHQPDRRNGRKFTVHVR